MTTIFVIILIILVYILQAGICCIINVYNTTRMPRNIKDFFKLLWLPYVIKNRKIIKIN